MCCLYLFLPLVLGKSLTDNITLEASKLSLQAGSFTILKDINLSVSTGEVLGIIGPNGAGKTSLLKCLTGALATSSGCVTLLQQDISQLSAMDIARHIAVVRQFNEMVFALDLQQVVKMGLLPHKTLLSSFNRDDQQRIEQALEQVGLSQKAHQLFSSLSGGEQQRALIARALVQQANTFVLDEPTNHLDIHYQHQILQLLKQLSRDLGLTVVMSVHDLNLAAMYCDRLCLLDKGQVRALGSVEHVLEPELLSGVFAVDCRRRRDELTGGLRIDSYPKTHIDNPEWQQ